MIKRLNENGLKFNYMINSDGTIVNIDSKKQNNHIKPYKDPRRPNEPPIIYLKKSDGKRLCMYHDELVAKYFIEDYRPGIRIIHKDGDINNCAVNNLYIGTGEGVLKNIYNEVKEWKPVNIGVPLYYEYYICEDGRLFNNTTREFIAPFVDTRERNKGYLRYNLYTGKSINDIIHVSASRLVASHFLIKNDPSKNIVLFKDNDKNNIDMSNLYYGDNWDSVMVKVSNSSKNREFTSLNVPILGDEKWKNLNKVMLKRGIILEDEYLISNFGRIYNNSKKFYVSILDSSKNNIGQSYKSVNLSVMNCKTHFMVFHVHRLVALAFIKNKDKAKTDINHINGNPSCNLYINLEWVTPFENMHHAIETNLIHTNKFKGKITDDLWRMNTILAWILSITDDLNDAYNIYTNYRKDYKDDIPDITFSEFTKILSEKLNDTDFIVLKKFYDDRYKSAI